MVEEMDGAPTHSYFHHYRTVNTFLDQAMLRVGLALQEEGWRYLPVPASQSVPTQEDPRGFHGRCSHKKAAILAGNQRLVPSQRMGPPGAPGNGVYRLSPLPGDPEASSVPGVPELQGLSPGLPGRGHCRKTVGARSGGIPAGGSGQVQRAYETGLPEDRQGSGVRRLHEGLSGRR